MAFVRTVRRTVPASSFPVQDGVVVDAVERIVDGRVFGEGLVADGVVGADHGPARLRTPVLVGFVQQVAVEEEGVAGIEFHMDQLVVFHGFFDKPHVRALLVAGALVVEPADVVGTFEHLEASVFHGGLVDGDHAADRLGVEHEVVEVPVAEILVPFPRAADEGLLHHDLGAGVVGRLANDALAGIDQPATARKHAIEIVARLLPEADLADRARGILPPPCALIEAVVAEGRLLQARNLLGTEVAPGNHIAVFVVFLDLLIR